MYKDPSFNTNISIENIRTENFIAYIYLKFLTVKPSIENKCYRLWIEDLDTGVFDLAIPDYLWIDRVDDANSSHNDIQNPNAKTININRNKIIYIPIRLFMQEVSNNRFIKRCKLHLKHQNITGEKEPSVWISDELILPSREIQVPEIDCKNIKILSDGKLQCKVLMNYPTSRDETNFNLYLIPYVLFYDKNNLIETEAVKETESNGSFVFKSTQQYCYDKILNKIINNKVNKIAIEVRFLNGSLACRKEFILDSFKNYGAFYANELDIIKCKSLGVTYIKQENITGPNTIGVKNVIDIYQKH